jgi:pimeloyl-ACP methyl ester carboxylesterase
MHRRSLMDSSGPFTASCIEIEDARRIVLFAVGAGGNPERHLGLLEALANEGSTIVAPHFERLASSRPTADELLLRARRLALSLDAIPRTDLPVFGVGHSIGATLLLALAGAQMWFGPEIKLEIALLVPFERLVMMAPPTGFFRAPGALRAVRTPIMVWAGSEDLMTPADQMRYLEHELANQVPVELKVGAGAGHYSFMNILPPGVVEPLADRSAFLDALARSICRYVCTEGSHSSGR